MWVNDCKIIKGHHIKIILVCRKTINFKRWTWLGGLIDGRMDGLVSLMHGCTDREMDGWMDGWMNESKNREREGWMDRRINKLIDGSDG